MFQWHLRSNRWNADRSYFGFRKIALFLNLMMSVCFTDPNRGRCSWGPSLSLSLFVSGPCARVWRTGQQRAASGGHVLVKAHRQRLHVGEGKNSASCCSQVSAVPTSDQKNETNRELTPTSVHDPTSLFSDILILPMWLKRSWLWWAESGCTQTTFQVSLSSTSTQGSAWTSNWTRFVLFFFSTLISSSPYENNIDHGTLHQGCQTYGHRAKTGPLGGFNPARLMIFFKVKKMDKHFLFMICFVKLYLIKYNIV